jgi:hypothetical protein
MSHHDKTYYCCLLLSVLYAIPLVHMNSRLSRQEFQEFQEFKYTVTTAV